MTDRVSQRILFVCRGNICRSPAACAVLKQQLSQNGLSDRVRVDSAGTGDWNLGSAPDQRMMRAAAKRGYDLSGQHARKVTEADFFTFDTLYSMDRFNLRELERIRLPGVSSALRLFTELTASGGVDGDIPDPYEGGEAGFEQVMDLIEEGIDTLIENLRQRLGEQR